jgi:hypothetical protein
LYNPRLKELAVCLHAVAYDDKADKVPKVFKLFNLNVLIEFMKIIICGSVSAAEEIFNARDMLEGKGHEVIIPEGVRDENLRKRNSVGISERTSDKIKYDLIRGYYEKIKTCDAVLVVNPEKKGIAGYIGGNTFLEMGFGFVLNKKLFCLYKVPEMPYTSEILAMRPTVLDGNLDLLK